MKKVKVLPSLLIPLLVCALFATTTSAGERVYDGHGYGKHGYSYGYKGHGYKGHGYKGGHFYKGRHYYKHGHHRGYYKYKGHDRHAEYLVGGLLLGGLLHHFYYQPRYRQPSVVHRTVIQRTPSTEATSRRHDTILAPGEYTRRLILEENGRCFELIERGDGSEQLTEKNPSVCGE